MMKPSDNMIIKGFSGSRVDLQISLRELDIKSALFKDRFGGKEPKPALLCGMAFGSGPPVGAKEEPKSKCT